MFIFLCALTLVMLGYSAWQKTSFVSQGNAPKCKCKSFKCQVNLFVFIVFMLIVELFCFDFSYVGSGITQILNVEQQCPNTETHNA